MAATAGDTEPLADVAPSAPPAPARSRPKPQTVMTVVLASIVGLSVAVSVHERRYHAAAPAVLPKPVQPAPVQLPPVVSNSASPTAPGTREPERAGEPAPAMAAPATSVAAPAAHVETTKVTLEVRPTDAKVHYLGRDWPGPPFVFELAKGERKAVEVARMGFVTAKVVLEDKKPIVKFGMLRQH